MVKNKIIKKIEEMKEIENNVKSIVDDEILKEEQVKKDVNKFIYIFGIVGPILAIFQAAKIYLAGTAAGVSMIYWGAYLSVGVMWFVYGLSYKNKPIMVSYGLWILIEIVILNGIYMYG